MLFGRSRARNKLAVVSALFGASKPRKQSAAIFLGILGLALKAERKKRKRRVKF